MYCMSYQLPLKALPKVCLVLSSRLLDIYAFSNLIANCKAKVFSFILTKLSCTEAIAELVDIIHSVSFANKNVFKLFHLIRAGSFVLCTYS